MPAIEYVGEAPTKDGIYLVKATSVAGYKVGLVKNSTERTELAVAKASVCNGEISWQQIGSDYDFWEFTDHRYRIEVVCRLDLDEIATAAKVITDAAETRKIIAIFEIANGFQNSPLSWFAETIHSRMKDAVSLLPGFEIVDSQAVRDKVRNGS